MGRVTRSRRHRCDGAFAGEVVDRRGDVLLQRVMGDRYGVGRPAVDRAGHHHATVLAAAIHLQRRRASAGASTPRRMHGRAEGPRCWPAIARRAQRLPGSDAPPWCAWACRRGWRRPAPRARAATADRRDHRHRLHRFVRRSWIDRRAWIAYGELDLAGRRKTDDRSKVNRLVEPTAACDRDRGKALRSRHRRCRS